MFKRLAHLGQVLTLGIGSTQHSRYLNRTCGRYPDLKRKAIGPWPGRRGPAQRRLDRPLDLPSVCCGHRLNLPVGYRLVRPPTFALITFFTKRGSRSMK